MPADADAGVVFRTKHLRDARAFAAIRLNLCDEREEPGWYLLRILQPLLGVVVAKAERRDAALALIDAELKWLQREC